MQIASTKMKHPRRIIRAVEVITRSLQKSSVHSQGYQSCAPAPHFFASFILSTVVNLVKLHGERRYGSGWGCCVRSSSHLPRTQPEQIDWPPREAGADLQKKVGEEKWKEQSHVRGALRGQGVTSRLGRTGKSTSSPKSALPPPTPERMKRRRADVCSQLFHSRMLNPINNVNNTHNVHPLRANSHTIFGRDRVQVFGGGKEKVQTKVPSEI